jgi:hypothetical protein
MIEKYKAEVFQTFNLNPFTANGKASPTYWRGAIRCGTKTVARTEWFKTRKAAERAVSKLLTQIEVAA